jgi:hypothetical protein
LQPDPHLPVASMGFAKGLIWRWRNASDDERRGKRHNATSWKTDLLPLDSPINRRQKGRF